MKKLINNAEDVITESLIGLQHAHADLLNVHFDPAYIVRKDAPISDKVAIVSGGGSGHEPLHGGFVGHGMLDAACPGAVFTSPTPDQILAATKAVDSGAGVLHIIKNYTGDVMNFEMAAELAAMEDITVQSVIINDDVAVEDSLYTAGRRGVGATVFAEKICGAAAERGDTLEEIAGLCKRVNQQARSIGVALTSCTVPLAGKPTFELPEDEMEFGIGIHGEPGRERIKMQTAKDITERMMSTLIEDLPYVAGDRLMVMVNGMGGTPLVELYIVYNHVVEICQRYNLRIERKLVGNYITSLEMAGASITLLKADDELLTLWDAPVHTAALRWGM